MDYYIPIGTVIENANASFNPNTFYKGTTWERIKGKVLVGVDEADTTFSTSGKTGGEKSRSLFAAIGATDGTPTRIGYIASAKITGKGYTYSVLGTSNTTNITAANVNHSVPVYNSDGTNPSNLQPYVTVFIWKRVA